MKILIAALTLGAGALLASPTHAAPISVNSSIQPDSGIQQVRLVCDEFGRCYRSRGPRVVIQQGYRDSYDYVPRERYIERRGYYDGYYDNGPSVGIGVGPGGVGVGVGVGPRW